MATYDNPGGKRKSYSVPNVELAECPTSLAWRYPELISVIHQSAQAQSISEEFGHALGSPYEWPARYYDMVSSIKMQGRAADNARMEADK